ncbi:hypothetical protein GCM10010399_54800 [Dactylosporangium fulvum]
MGAEIILPGLGVVTVQGMLNEVCYELGEFRQSEVPHRVPGSFQTEGLVHLDSEAQAATHRRVVDTQQC